MYRRSHCWYNRENHSALLPAKRRFSSCTQDHDVSDKEEQRRVTAAWARTEIERGTREGRREQPSRSARTREREREWEKSGETRPPCSLWRHSVCYHLLPPPPLSVAVCTESEQAGAAVQRHRMKSSDTVHGCTDWSCRFPSFFHGGGRNECRSTRLPFTTNFRDPRAAPSIRRI